MRTQLRILPVMALMILALSVALVPAHGQDLLSFTDPGGTCDRNGDGALDVNDGTNIFAIEAVDAMTVQFTLCRPDPAFPQKAAFSAFGIHPSEYLEETGGGGDLITQPIGTGPYMLERWDQGTELVLTRFDDYWGEPAKEQTAIFRWNAEAAARLVELQAGTTDGIDNPGTGDFEVIAADPNLALLERPPTNVFYLGVNNTVPPFDNVLVRQAVAHAVDRQRIVDNFYPTGSLAATQFMPPVIFGNTSEVDPFPFDPDRARELLEEAGVELPIETTLSYRDVVRVYLPTPGIVAQDIQAQLAEVGINVEIVVMESGAFIEAADAGELSLHLLGWGADFPDATNFLDFHFGAGASDQFGTKHSEIFEPLSRAAALSDPDERLSIYVEANTAIRDLVPMVPIAHGISATAFRANIEGAHSSPLGNEALTVMEDPNDDDIVWMQNAEPISLYCADETDGETLRACEQINEPLLAYEVGGTDVVPALATEFEANENATVWTFHLRDGVTFHDGSDLDANDVVLSWGIQWDPTNPLHVGKDGSFTYFAGFFEGFLESTE